MEKKIKKVKKESKSIAKDFINQIDDDQKEINKKKKDTAEKRKDTMKKLKDTPSKAVLFRKWEKKDVEKWTAVDFFGWYLHCYNECFKEEDIAFKGKYKGEQVKVEVYRMSYFLKTYFENDKQSMKDFIDFCCDFAADPDTFYTTFGFWHIFNKKMFMYKMFIEKQKAPKGKGKRKKVDNDFSSNDAWSKYKGV